jgi:hypothetical protein
VDLAAHARSAAGDPASLRRARLFARTDPVHDGTAAQVDELISAGVQMLMLPYFRTPEEVAEFLGVVDGRAGSCCCSRPPTPPGASTRSSRSGASRRCTSGSTTSRSGSTILTRSFTARDRPLAPDVARSREAFARWRAAPAAELAAAHERFKALTTLVAW